MQHSSFQFGLVAVLALGLGFSLASKDAVGYPAGAAVSAGINPVWSVGGHIDSAGSTPVLTAPEDADMVITDIYFTSQCTNCAVRIALDTSTERVASYKYWQSTDGGPVMESVVSPHPIKQSMSSGIRVPAGESLSIDISSHYIDYTLAGYLARP